MTEGQARQSSDEAPFGAYVGPAPRYRGYTSHSCYVPMRDGVRLAVEVVLPKGLPPGVRLPALLEQTRYWRVSELRAPFKWFLKPDDLNPDYRGFKPFFTGQGYALVIVDVRGTGASFGSWPYPWSRKCLDDAREIVDWIVAQPWSNGRVGGYGVSYTGTTAELLGAIQHPAVKALVPMFNHPDPYLDIAFPGGIFNKRFIKAWGELDRTLDENVVPREFGLLGRLLVRGVRPVDGDRSRQRLRAAIAAHAINGNVYHMARRVDFRDRYDEALGICVDDLGVHHFREAIEATGVPIFGWGSWLDAGTADAVLRRFLTFDNARWAVIGPWNHGGQYHASPYRSPRTPTTPPLPAQWWELVRFFDAYLKDDGDDAVRSERALFYYTLGQERWKRTATWPPAGTTMQRWYLREERALLPAAPERKSGADTYSVDFEASSGPHNRWWELGTVLKQTVIYPDRASQARHLLSYTSPPLEQDMEITGYPVVTLYVASTHPDGAFYVYLEDVDPGGRVTYVTEGLLRAVHRRVCPPEGAPYKLQVPYHTFRQAEAMPLVPGEVAAITFGLLPTSVLIHRGHRIRVSIAGHDAGTFARIPAEGEPVITVARNQAHASYIDLPVVGRA